MSGGAGAYNGDWSDEIIELERGYEHVKGHGIDPFMEFIEKQERQFFKAKDFVALYDLIFKMCIQRDPYNWSEAMYERYTHSILDYLLTKVTPSLNVDRLSSHDATFLKQWKQRWYNQKLIVQGLAKLFMYLDRFYTPNTDGVCSLKEQGYKLYKENIFDHFSSYARQAILNAIEKERNHEEQDRHLLQESVSVFVEMGYNYASKKLQVYTSDLEKYVVEHAGAYYQRKSVTWMEQDSCPVYLEKAEAMLNAEKHRVESYLNRNTLDPLLKECYQKLLKTHQRELLKKKTGLHHLLATNSVTDLSRLYRLYKNYESDLEPIAEMFLEHIKTAGSEIVENAQNSSSSAPAPAAPAAAADGAAPAPAVNSADANHALVKSLIDLHAQYNEIVTVCFEKAQVMQKALKKAFEDFINKDNRVSKLLAKFVNDVLKKGTKVNVKDVEATLDNVVFLYGYIQEKDVFERDYQLFLATRLLMGLCESEHSEKSMIAKLKTECGYQWTNKLEGMFKDVQLSKDLMAEFKKVMTASVTSDVQLDVNVCTTGMWPSTNKSQSCKMPAELTPSCEKYQRFYLNKHSGHKLEWRYDQGQAELAVDFSSSMRRGLVCSTYQMMILLVFNNFKRVTYKQILDVTGIPRFECANHLLSLCHPKVNVVLKRPNTKKLEDNHQFMLNGGYKNQMKKVSIPLLKAVENEESGEEENKAIELQRRHQMDAAIVRIMKTRKTLRHNMLVAEVVSQLSARFKPKPNDIKKRIEALIEQEYMERDANERGTYNYLA